MRWVRRRGGEGGGGGEGREGGGGGEDCICVGKFRGRGAADVLR